MTLDLKLLYKLMDLALLAKVIAIEDVQCYCSVLTE